MAYDCLKEKSGSKEYIKILELAAKENESLVDNAIEELIRGEKEISFEVIREMVIQGQRPEKHREINISRADTSVYDALLEGVAA